MLSKWSRVTLGKAEELLQYMRKEVPLIDKKRTTVKKKKVGNEAIPLWQFLFVPVNKKRSILRKSSWRMYL